MTPRGAGTGLVGGALGAGLIVDFSRHNRQITDLDLERQTVRVKDVMLRESHVAFQDEDLFTILKRFAAKDVSNLPVVTHEKPDCPMGLVTRSGLWAALETAKEMRASRATAS